MTDYPHVPAAFINAIAEGGTKAEAVEYLQKQWNEVCALRKALEEVHQFMIADQITGDDKLWTPEYENLLNVVESALFYT